MSGDGNPGCVVALAAGHFDEDVPVRDTNGEDLKGLLGRGIEHRPCPEIEAGPVERAGDRALEKVGVTGVTALMRTGSLDGDGFPVEIGEELGAPLF